MSTIPPIRCLDDIVALERSVPIESHGFAETTSALIARAAARWPHRLAVTALDQFDDLNREESRTYSQLWAEIRSAAALFQEWGAERQDRICYIMGSSLDTMLAIWGGQLAGIIAPINPYLEAEALGALLKAIDPKILIVDLAIPGLEIWSKVQSSLAGLPSLRAIFVANAGDMLPDVADVPVFDFRRSLPAQDCADSNKIENMVCGEDVAAYFHTGGTTGVPKLVTHTHRAEAYSSSLMASLLDWQCSDVTLMTLPLFHTNGVLLSTLSAFACGAHVVIAGRSGFRDPALAERFWDVVEAYHVSSFSAVPSIFAALLDKRIPSQRQVRSLRFAISGGAPLSAELKKRAESLLGISIIEGYGLTEATLCVAINPPFGEHRAGSIGLRAPYQDVRIVKLSEGAKILADCPPKQVGELVVRSYSVTPGYRAPSSNCDLFTAEGYLKTGDLGYFDEDGYIWLTGRSKDLIIRGGHNIDPSEIENALAAHPEVRLAAAVGQIDAFAGELPVAFVTLANGATADPDALREFVKSFLAERAAIPKRIEILDDLPLTSVGKIDKRSLRRRAASFVLAAQIEASGEAASVAISEDGAGAMIARISGEVSSDFRRAVGLLPIRIEYSSVDGRF